MKPLTNVTFTFVFDVLPAMLIVFRVLEEFASFASCYNVTPWDVANYFGMFWELHTTLNQKIPHSKLMGPLSFQNND